MANMGDLDALCRGVRHECQRHCAKRDVLIKRFLIPSARFWPLALVLTYRSSGVINFATGAIALSFCAAIGALRPKATIPLTAPAPDTPPRL